MLPIDHAADMKELATLTSHPRSLDALLGRALEALEAVVPYDLAAILELRGDDLSVRAARGPLAGQEVRGHHLSLDRFPTLRRAMESRRPIALTEHHHASEEGDPWDGVLDLPEGHSCMVVPLFSGERSLGVITLDRRVCQPYDVRVVDLAGVYGQLVALAMMFAEQADLLDRYRRLLEERNRLLTEEVGGASTAPRRMTESRSEAMRRLARQAQQVAATDTPVLIRGETGVGKEVLAQAIHAWSRRADAVFVKLNCAAIPEGLIESELFGHVEGAFSGATSSRPGRFATATGGTLLLDEIGDLPLSAQAKLLRVLQEGTFEPVGSDRTVKVDVRVIAATHVDLEAAARAGRFRQDLFYRLDVFPLTLPPLRERPEDVVPIARQVLEDLTRRTGRGPWTLSDAAMGWLSAQPWPGNVRQLVNTLERATILTPAGPLQPETLAGPGGLDGEGHPPMGPRPGGGAPTPERPPTLEEMERRHIALVLDRTGGRVYGEGGAADLLGLKPTTLQSRMKKLGIRRLPTR